MTLYIAEGYKRSRNVGVALQLRPATMRLANAWLGRLSIGRRFYRLQHHADQDLDELRAFWGVALGIDPGRALPAASPTVPSSRTDAGDRRYGVLTVGVNDTQLRAQLQGWIDSLQDQWLISASSGV